MSCLMKKNEFPPGDIRRVWLGLYRVNVKINCSRLVWADKKMAFKYSASSIFRVWESIILRISVQRRSISSVYCWMADITVLRITTMRTIPRTWWKSWIGVVSVARKQRWVVCFTVSITLLILVATSLQATSGGRIETRWRAWQGWLDRIIRTRGSS